MSLSELRSVAAACALVGLAFMARPARADDCVPAQGLSPCFDADALWVPAERAHFVAIPSTAALPASSFALGLAVGALRHPVTLRVDSPDRDGRNVDAVDFALDTSLSLAAGIVDSIDLTAILPARLYQNGAGTAGVTAQSAPSITASALRDPRIGFSYSLDERLRVRGLGAKLTFELGIPLGNELAFAGERSFVAAPSGIVSFRAGRLETGLLLGARLRQTSEFGGVRLGTQAVLALGVGVSIVEPRLLVASLEAFGLPSLVQESSSSARTSVSQRLLFPAEWLLSVTGRPAASSAFGVTLAGGTGIPLSSETAGTFTEHMLGLTAPTYRALVALTYAPKGAVK